jgi:hypothetical protein
MASAVSAALMTCGFKALNLTSDFSSHPLAPQGTPGKAVGWARLGAGWPNSNHTAFYPLGACIPLQKKKKWFKYVLKGGSPPRLLFWALAHKISGAYLTPTLPQNHPSGTRVGFQNNEAQSVSHTFTRDNPRSPRQSACPILRRWGVRLRQMAKLAPPGVWPFARGGRTNRIPKLGTPSVVKHP